MKKNAGGREKSAQSNGTAPTPVGADVIPLIGKMPSVTRQRGNGNAVTSSACGMGNAHFLRVKSIYIVQISRNASAVVPYDAM